MSLADNPVARMVSRWPKRRWWVAGGAAVLAVAALALILSNGKGKTQYRTAEATRATIESTITALGKIQPKNYVDVGAQVSGQLKKMHVDVGDRVKQGDLLAEIDPVLLQARVDAARAQLRELRATRAKQMAELKLARSRHQRNQRMLAADAISRDEAEAAEAALAVAQAQLKAQDAQIDRLTSTLQGDEANLNYTRIYAPMPGTVVSLSALEGQTLNANQTTPTILRIADLTVMTVSADVSEADVTRLKAGMPAYFNTLGNQERRWHTEVRQVLPQPEIVNDVVLYKALLDVENEGQALLPEMTAQIFFVLGRAEDVVVVPVAAVKDPAEFAAPATGRRRSGRRRDGQEGAGRTRRGPRREGGRGGERRERSEQADTQDGTRKIVLVVSKGEPEPRPVRVGLTTRTEAEIRSGLEVGETVVVGQVTRLANDGESRSLVPTFGRRRRGQRGGR